jgi:hypothetical protein
MHSYKEIVSCGKMVEIKAPLRLKDLEGRLAILFRLLIGDGSKKELFDTEKMVMIKLKRQESIVLMDRNDNLWELFKNKKGHYKLKRLKGKQYENKA